MKEDNTLNELTKSPDFFQEIFTYYLIFNAGGTGNHDSNESSKALLQSIYLSCMLRKKNN